MLFETSSPESIAQPTFKGRIEVVEGTELQRGVDEWGAGSLPFHCHYVSGH